MNATGGGSSTAPGDDLSSGASPSTGTRGTGGTGTRTGTTAGAGGTGASGTATTGTGPATTGTATTTTTGGEGSTTETGAGGTTGGYAEPPTDCPAGVRPHTSEACGRALEEYCDSFDTEESCHDGNVFALDDWIFACAWAKVVSFSELGTCAIDTVEWRCVAGHEERNGSCANQCDPASLSPRDNLMASTTELQLYEMPCPRVSWGPVGEWTAQSYQDQHGSLFARCHDGGSPPPAVCDCSADACGA